MSSYRDQSSQQGFRWHYSEFENSNFQIRGRTLFFLLVLFTAILLVGLLFLYAKWVCRFGPTPPPPTCRPASVVKVNKLPGVIYRSGDDCGGECCICLGIFVVGDNVKFIPHCKHCFHSDCVDNWLLLHSTCPLCRAFVPLHSPV